MTDLPRSIRRATDHRGETGPVWVHGGQMSDTDRIYALTARVDELERRLAEMTGDGK